MQASKCIIKMFFLKRFGLEKQDAQPLYSIYSTQAHFSLILVCLTVQGLLVWSSPALLLL